jgi:NADPH-dependent 2,4-dienoyl-CoA reductase/sulfur reductase-like enzyme
MKGRRILVIGGLAAGPSAASKAARTNPSAEVVLFEQGDAVSYGVCEIPYHIAGALKASDLLPFTPGKLQETRRIDVRVLHRVEEIQPGKRTIRVREIPGGRTSLEKFDRLIIATGSRPRRLGFEGEESRNVFRVKALDEGLALRKFVAEEHPRTAVIIGGGYIGMEMAEALRTLGVGVTVLHNSGLPIKTLEQETSERVREELERNGVTFVGMAQTTGFACGRDGKVTHVLTRDGAVEAGIVVVAIGVEPNAGLARAAGIRTGPSGGIHTDQRQQTSADDIYAAGDCCEVKNLVTGKQVYIPLATIASKAGWTAGENAAGGSAIFRGAIRAIAVRVFTLEVAQVGVSEKDAREAGFDPVSETITAPSRVAAMPGSEQVTVRLIADRTSQRVLGANVTGREGAVLRANTLVAAIQQKVTIGDIQQWDLAYSPPFTPLWDPLLVAANAMQRKLRSS